MSHKKEGPLRVLLITPPFTQLNTPYPATMYLKGYLNTLGIETRQADLGIEVFHCIFNAEGIKTMFEKTVDLYPVMDANSQRIYALRAHYMQTIDPVISFLCGHNPTLAYQICQRNYLPEAARFDHLLDLELKFGEMGIMDLAKHLATLYLEDLGDFISRWVDEHFGFSRYAESLARTASSFDPLLQALETAPSWIGTLTRDVLKNHVDGFQPDLVAISVPFPGNVLGAFFAADWIKQYTPGAKVAMGGGFVNTELRRIQDERVFKYIDFICTDDGEAPLAAVLDYMSGHREQDQLKRTFVMHNGTVCHMNGANEKDIAQRETGTPDYSDLYLDKYVSVLELANPMHRLWSDGRWNKLTLAHGCYWGKCSFCDISLDYISRYEPISAAMLCDRISEIMNQTGQSGFHFVDEAAPPALMGELALEIIRRDIKISWWTNIRFEKTFTPDLCRLLKASGCIAVTGGLEVASDRLLEKMKKGVTVAQVSRVASAFRNAGIMVHAYLMYGFPTQTAEETIDSLEVVRQLFKEGVLQSGFWHRFAMTAHSPVGLHPESYDVVHTGPEFKGFAENDYFFEDAEGTNHDDFTEGLRASLYNYMNGAGFELPLQNWFEQKVPKTSHASNLINKYLNQENSNIRPNAMVYFLGKVPVIADAIDGLCELIFYKPQGELCMELYEAEAAWIDEWLNKADVKMSSGISYVSFVDSYKDMMGEEWEEESWSELIHALKEAGLTII
ncbi:MAG: radical SAM protein [Saprospiraceae bacterium]|nr:radical SAM protein [Saprospiraceae bacterium]